MEFLEKLFYSRPGPPKRTREKPMQVLALGMSRSGTESLRRALIILGYDHVYHGYDTIEDYGVIGWKPWTMLARRKFGKHGQNGDSGIGREDFDELIGHCEAVTDQPCAIFAPELIKAYPEAKVILNYRDTESWYRSGYETNARIAAWFNPLFMVLFSAGLYWNIRYTTDCFFPYFYGSLFDHGKWVYEEHSAKIRGFTPSDRLLEWTAKDGWEPLCKFLDKPIPSEDFPSGNSLDTLEERCRKTYDREFSIAKRNFSVFMFCVGAPAAAFVIQRLVTKGL